MSRLPAAVLFAVTLVVHAWPISAVASLDIDDQGPTLKAGAFEMRVTNAGILGNAFPERSSDPSLEYPLGSGQELLHYAALWVGARTDQGPRVSGGPLLEWRPTPAPEDRVRIAWHGRRGSRQAWDDDRDGTVDEEKLNGRDDDGDGEVDEDLGIPGQQILSADYADDRPEAVYYVYPRGERHVPIGLSVHQEVYGWSTPGYDGIAGIDVTITNHGDQSVQDVYAGFFVDLDCRMRDDPVGHSNDRIASRAAFRDLAHGTSALTVLTRERAPIECIERVEQVVPVLWDPHANLPACAVVGLGHTTDPLSRIGAEVGLGSSLGSAPGQVAFKYTVFTAIHSPGSGGPPLTDEQRYEALAGRLPGAEGDIPEDYVVLVSCGPFRSIAPGKSISFRAALIVAPTLDDISEAIGGAFQVHDGSRVNLLPDSTGLWSTEWNVGRSGLNGHDACVSAPAGRSFRLDPHCGRVIDAPGLEETYTGDRCIWTDSDCSKCTGFGGNETVIRWSDPGFMPPPPTVHVVPQDRSVRVEWDNLPEILLEARIAGPPEGEFVGYAVYRVSDWRSRRSALPPRESFALIAHFGRDSAVGQVPLATITDTTVDYVDRLYERRRYPPGRYAFVDREVLNGFDYVYVVATIVDQPYLRENMPLRRRLESPLVASSEDVIRPRAEARARGRGVWVVPNPFRGTAGWDRPPVYGDPFSRHIDFMGLPRATCVIRIWTAAGDLVREIRHDGTGGSGQASWDLITRNGQDAESGLYLFTVHSPAGDQRGRFVVIR